MRKAFLPVLLVSLALTPSGAPADDWPQWRGALRNGVAPNSPALVNAFGEDGPKRLWLSEPLMGEDAERFGTGRMSSPGGEGSVSVAAGRVYVCVNINVDVPMTERKIDTKRFGALERRAWDPKVPKAYVDAVEAARLSEARRKLQSETEIRNWTNRWMKENEKPEYRKYRAFASTRLKDGPEALAFDVMKKLLTIRKRMFASQAELDKWFDDNGIDQPSRKYLTERKHIQTVARKGRDLLYCLDADTGKRIWKAEMPGSWMHYVCAFTPAVSAGRCYMLTSEAVVWCFDAKDGKKIWQSKVLGTPKHQHNRSSSVLVMDGILVTETDTGLHALDIETGEVKWSNPDAGDKEASATSWKTGGVTYILSVGKKKVHCIDPKTGKALWSVPEAGQTFTDWRGEFNSTPAVVGDAMSFCGGYKLGLTAYKLSVDKPSQLWNVKGTDQYASPVIHEGHVYFIGGGRARCVALASGKMTWEKRLQGQARLSSPVLADGKLFAVVAPYLYVIKADPEKYQLLAKARLGLTKWTSPSIADGRLYLRIGKSVACYAVTTKRGARRDPDEVVPSTKPGPSSSHSRKRSPDPCRPGTKSAPRCTVSRTPFRTADTRCSSSRMSARSSNGMCSFQRMSCTPYAQRIRRRRR